MKEYIAPISKFITLDCEELIAGSPAVESGETDENCSNRRDFASHSIWGDE